MNKKQLKRQLKQRQQESVGDAVRRQIEAVKQGAEMAILNHMALTLYALRTKFGFSKVRLQRFHDEMIKHAKDFNEGVFNYEDIVSEMEHETGFNLSEFLGKVGEREDES